MTKYYIKIGEKYLKNFKLYEIELTNNFDECKVITCKTTLFEAKKAVEHNGYIANVNVKL